MRLSKRVAELGACSRREADEFIERGWVRVDGVVVGKLGSRVAPQQQVVLARDESAAPLERATILLNKPAGYVYGRTGHGQHSAIALVSPQTRFAGDDMRAVFSQAMLRGLAAIELDADSTGLLVLTQEGTIARRLCARDSDIEHEYLVKVEGTLDPAALASLNFGLALDGKTVARAKVSWQSEQQLRFATREGNPVQVRRLCALVNLVVTGLKRIRIGRIPLGRLPEGQWRLLGPNERF
ncbi:MAG: pseudouridylate synthase [Betaproteobacteria bacterium]|nr:pseudouridylate synthase [Betaproteobacteria bacterium]